jgi:ketosteroid isomerase-like protein
MSKLAMALIVALLAAGTAKASDKTDVVAVAHKWADAFNRSDGKTGAAFCADGAVIIDDFAPHVWQG